MPDITMCQPTNCDKKETCYRYTATPSERQAFNDFSSNNYPFTQNFCAFFVDQPVAKQGIFRP